MYYKVGKDVITRYVHISQVSLPKYDNKNYIYRCDWQTVQIVRSVHINIILVVYINVSLRSGVLAEVYFISTTQIQFHFEMMNTNFVNFLFCTSPIGSMITWLLSKLHWFVNRRKYLRLAILATFENFAKD